MERMSKKGKVHGIFFISVCDWDLGLCYVLLYMHRTCLDMLLCDSAQMESVGLSVLQHIYITPANLIYRIQGFGFQTDYLP